VGTGARAPVYVEFRETGMEEVRRGLRLVRNEGEAAGRVGGEGSDRISHGAQNVAAAFSEMAHTGEAGQRSVRELIKSGAEMALTFGVGGPIVGAFGLLGLTIYNVFEHAREEIKKTQTEAIEQLEKLRSGGDLMASAKAQQEAYSGNRFAIQKPDEDDAKFFGRKEGYSGVKSQVERLRDQLPTEALDYIEKHGKTIENMGYSKEIERVGKEYHDLLPILDELKKKYFDLANITAVLSKEQGERDAIKLRHDQEANAIIDADRRVQMIITEGRATGMSNEMIKEAISLRAKLREELATMRLDPARREELQHNIGELSSLPGLAQPNGIFPNLPIKLPGGARSIVDMMFPVNDPLVPEVAPRIAPILKSAKDQIVEAFIKQVHDPIADTLQNGLASSITGGLTAGIAAGFAHAKIGMAVTLGGRAIIAAIGTMIQQEGEIWLKYGIIKTGLMTALQNPFTSGPAAIAAGTLLIAAGAAISGIYSGAGSGGGSSSFAGLSAMPQIIDRGYINTVGAAASGVSARDSVTQNNFIIGSDPRAWRQIQTELDNNAKRSG
jgi:hypothetical protein